MSVAATLDGPQAADERWDLVVVGGGPSGALLAMQTATAGLDTLIVDRGSFPRHKVCGGCMSARTLAHLDERGLGKTVRRLGGHRLDRLHLGAWSRSAELPLPAGMSLSRRALDTALLRRAISGGAHFLPRCRAALGPSRGDSRVVDLEVDSVRLATRAAVVVDATGLGGALIGEIGGRLAGPGGRVGCSAVTDAPARAYGRGVIHMAVGRHGYVGAVRFEDGRLNLAAAIDQGAMRARGAGAAVREILSAAGFASIDGLEETPWRGTPRLAQRPRHRALERVFAVGDAAGYVEPFTGEGIGWALRSADLLAPIVTRAATRWTPSLVQRWNREYAREIARRQAACRVLARLLRRPLMVRMALALLQRRPQLGAPLVRHLHGTGLDAGRVACR